MREYQCGFGVLRWDEVNDSRWRLRMNLNAHASPVKIVADGRARSVDFGTVAGTRKSEDLRPTGMQNRSRSAGKRPPASIFGYHTPASILGYHTPARWKVDGLPSPNTTNQGKMITHTR